MGALDLIAKAAKGAKKAAPFFSKADVVLDELQRGKGTGQEFLTELVKKGAKPTELRERGIEKALKDAPKMTKAEVQKVFEQKAPPKVQEKVLTSDAPDYEEFLETKAQEIYGVDYFDLRKEERAKIDKMFDDLPLTQYDKFKTPGGENYREILLKLPSFDDRRLMELEAEIRRSEGVYRDPMSVPSFRAKLKELEDLKAEKAAAGTPYISSHYRQDPNLLAHIRVQDFSTPEGKKVLLVDEIQSDWHQEGRKKGYRTEDVEKRRAELTEMAAPYIDSNRAVPKEIYDELMSLPNNFAPPDAPFKKNWHELAMKRVLDYAAENGYDTVAITPGAEQAKRYDLSKHIDELHYNPELQTLVGKKDREGKLYERGVTPEKLEEYVGKDMAAKLIAQEPTEHGLKSLAGQDLIVGGEGMKGFYDKILPDYLNTYGKQYGVGVGQIDLITKPEKSVPQIAAPGIGHFPEPLIEPAEILKAHSFEITPQMREAIKTKGQPLYSAMGAEGLAGASGAATIGSNIMPVEDEQPVQNPVHFTENPDAMRLELMQRN